MSMTVTRNFTVPYLVAGDSSGTRVFPMDVIQTFSFKIFISKGFLIDLIELDK
jgi:hypothetical protein